MHTHMCIFTQPETMVFPFWGAIQEVTKESGKHICTGHHTLTSSLHKNVYTEKQTSYYIPSDQQQYRY